MLGEITAGRQCNLAQAPVHPWRSERRRRSFSGPPRHPYACPRRATRSRRPGGWGVVCGLLTSRPLNRQAWGMAHVVVLVAKLASPWPHPFAELLLNFVLLEDMGIDSLRHLGQRADTFRECALYQCCSRSVHFVRLCSRTIPLSGQLHSPVEISSSGNSGSLFPTVRPRDVRTGVLAWPGSGWVLRCVKLARLVVHREVYIQDRSENPFRCSCISVSSLIGAWADPSSHSLPRHVSDGGRLHESAGGARRPRDPGRNFRSQG